jgi:hypothetical protein
MQLIVGIMGVLIFLPITMRDLKYFLSTSDIQDLCHSLVALIVFIATLLSALFLFKLKHFGRMLSIITMTLIILCISGFLLSFLSLNYELLDYIIRDAVCILTPVLLLLLVLFRLIYFLTRPNVKALFK